MDIIIDSDGVKKLTNELNEYSSELEEEIKKIRDIVNNISVAWNGDDASKYIEILQDKYILGLEELKEIITEYIVYLNIVPEAYETLDDIYSANYIEV